MRECAENLRNRARDSNNKKEAHRTLSKTSYSRNTSPANPEMSAEVPKKEKDEEIDIFDPYGAPPDPRNVLTAVLT